MPLGFLAITKLGVGQRGSHQARNGGRQLGHHPGARLLALVEAEEDRQRRDADSAEDVVDLDAVAPLVCEEVNRQSSWLFSHGSLPVNAAAERSHPLIR